MYSVFKVQSTEMKTFYFLCLLLASGACEDDDDDVKYISKRNSGRIFCSKVSCLYLTSFLTILLLSSTIVMATLAVYVVLEQESSRLLWPLMLFIPFYISAQLLTDMGWSSVLDQLGGYCMLGLDTGLFIYF